jgi:putative sigma-54 modulation protein
MKIIIKTKNLELTPALETYIYQKIGALEKFSKTFQKQENSKTLAEIFVEIEKITKHHRKGEIFKAEAQVSLPGKSLVAESTGEDLLKEIIKVKEKLEQEIKKYKTKHSELKIRKARKQEIEI